MFGGMFFHRVIHRFCEHLARVLGGADLKRTGVFSDELFVVMDSSF